MARLGGGHALPWVGDPPPQLGSGNERGSSREGDELSLWLDELDEELEL